MGIFIKTFFIAVILLSFAHEAVASSIVTPDSYHFARKGACKIWYTQKNRGVVTQLAQTCKHKADRIYTRLGVTPPSSNKTFIPVNVLILQTPSDFKTYAPKHMSLPHWSGALAFPSHNYIFLSLQNSRGEINSNLNITLAHELAHIAFKAAAGDAQTPRWFTEGLAILQSEGSSVVRRKSIWWASLINQMPRLKEIEQYPEGSTKATEAYAQAAGFIAFITDKYGFDKINSVLSLINTRQKEPETFDTAFKKSFGLTVIQLEYKWRSRIFSSKEWMIKLTNTAVWLGFGAILCIIGFIIVTKRKKQRLIEMEKEEEPVDDIIETIDEIMDSISISSEYNSEIKENLNTDRTEKNRKNPVQIEVDGQKYTLH